MILHCSQRLAAKLPAVSPTPLEEASPLGSWHGHLLTIDHRQCVMFCHDATRHVLFLPGLRKEQFAVLGERWFRSLYLVTLAVIGCPDKQLKKVELALGPMRGKLVWPDRAMREAVAALCWIETPLSAFFWAIRDPGTPPWRLLHPPRFAGHPEVVNERPGIALGNMMHATEGANEDVGGVLYRDVAARKDKRSNIGRLQCQLFELAIADAFVSGEDDPATLSCALEPGFVGRTSLKVLSKSFYRSAGIAQRRRDRGAVERLVQEEGELLRRP
jgi:Domain of unknown function (DUF6933)